MTNQILRIKANKDSQFYIKHKFSLADLVDVVPYIRVFTIETHQIQVNMSENFTFGTDRYILRMPKSPDNQKRILYYALLCYLFEMCNDTEASKYQEAFVQYVLEKCEVILPYKRVSTNGHKVAMPMMTTNQIKASFAKFINLLKQRIRREKMVLEEISTLPQIDFVFMSIFHMYLRKNNNFVEECAQNFMRDFGINIEAQEDGFILNDECSVERKASNDQWDRFFITKVNLAKPSKVSIELKRKNTTESVGSVDENDWVKTQQELNEALCYDELINARFVESCEAQEAQQIQRESGFDGAKKKISPFFMQVEDMLFVKKQKSDHQICESIRQEPKQRPRAKRTSFLNKNMQASKMSMIERQRSKRQKLKTQTSSKNLTFNTDFSYRPWSPKQDKPSSKFNPFASSGMNNIQQTVKAVTNVSSSKVIKISFFSDPVKEFSLHSQENTFSQTNDRFPEKRQTLQKLVFNYGNAYMHTS